MTTQARMPNPRGAGGRLRDDLVSAARTLLLTASPVVPLSLRAVAKAVGVSPTAVYAHFDSVESLVDAVVDDQSALLAAALDAPGLPAAGDERIAELARRYVRWGTANPGAYQLLFESADRLPHRVGPGTPGWAMIDALTADVAAVLDATPAEAAVLAVRGWVGLHGLVSLRLHKPGLHWQTSADDEAAATVRGVLLAARAGRSGSN